MGVDDRVVVVDVLEDDVVVLVEVVVGILEGGGNLVDDVSEARGTNNVT